MIPEIELVQIEPRVLEIDETIASAGISLLDTAKTGLEEKGTGVRGSLLLAMLRYIAEHSRRSVIFAVEEPEAFLHPSAQEEVRDDLERLAERADVTLLTTTHSPFVVSRSPAAQIIGVEKATQGQTRIVECCAGDRDASKAIGTLFRDAALPNYLERAAKIPSTARGIVVVEGLTDETYLRRAAELGVAQSAATNISIVAADGAKSAATQAVILRQSHDAPVLVLFDFEPETKQYMDMLRNTFGFRGEAVFTYREWGPAPNSDDPVEAEGLFPQQFLEAFVNAVGEDAVVSEKVKIKSGDWRYGFNTAGKPLFAQHVEECASERDLVRFGEVWKSIEERVTKMEAAARRRAA